MPPALRARFLRFEHLSTAVAMTGACAMLLLALGAGVWQIVSRFVIQEPAEWSEVIVRFALIWMVFLGSPMAFREGAMVCVDLLYRRSPARVRRLLDAMVSLCALTLVSVMLWWGIEYALRGSVQTVPGLESFSMSWAYFAIPVGSVFSIVGILGFWSDPRRHELDTAQ